MCVNHVWKPCLLKHSPEENVLSNIQNPKQGVSRGLARLEPSLAASWDHPPYSPKWKKVKSALWAFELKSENFRGCKFFCVWLQIFSLFWGGEWKKVNNCEEKCVTATLIRTRVTANCFHFRAVWPHVTELCNRPNMFFWGQGWKWGDTRGVPPFPEHACDPTRRSSWGETNQVC